MNSPLPPLLIEPGPPDEFGPDVSGTPLGDIPEPAAPTTRTKRETASGKKRFWGGLGKNSPARSGVRQLTEADRDGLAKYYVRIGGMVKYVHPALSAAMIANADDCAESWVKLAGKNVRVRARILAILEGGEMMGVLIAHSPLFIACLPEEFVTRILMRFTSNIEGLFSAMQFTDENLDGVTPEDFRLGPQG